MIETLIFLTVKHFIVDVILQNPYQYLNKGKFLHPGGLLHVFLPDEMSASEILKNVIDIVSTLKEENPNIGSNFNGKEVSTIIRNQI